MDISDLVDAAINLRVLAYAEQDRFKPGDRLDSDLIRRAIHANMMVGAYDSAKRLIDWFV